MKNILKRFIFILFILSNFSLFSSNNFQIDSWRILQKAQQEFDNNNFSVSMTYCQNAISKRKQECESAVAFLKKTLRPYEVRRVGNFISDILVVLKERQEYDAIEIIEHYITIYGSDFFENSITNLLNYIEKSIEYPEADFLIAKIYKIEGEYKLALDYLIRASKNVELLEIPAMKIDIYYEISDIAEYLNDTVIQEKNLLFIVKNKMVDSVDDKTFNSALLRTSRSVKENYSSKFFSLYRIDGIYKLEAYFKLSQIYYNAKNYKDAYLNNLYGVLVSFTHIDSILKDRDSDYEYTTLENFFKEISRYEDILEWCNNMKFWKGFCDIYDLGNINQFTRFPKDVLKVLAKSCPDKYWKNVAIEKLSNSTVSKN